MFALDLPSLSLVGMLTSMLLPVVLFAASRVTQADAASRSWTRGAMYYTLGFIGLALRGWMPDIFSIVLANSLMVLGYGELLIGIRQFFGRPINRVWLWRAVAVYVLIQSWLTFGAPSLPGRIVLASLFLLTLSLLITRELLGKARLRRRSRVGTDDPAERSLLFMLAAAFTISGLFMGIRAVALALSTAAETMQLLSAFSFIIGIALNFLLAAGLPLLVALRGKIELQHSESSLRRTQQVAGVGSIEINQESGAIRTNEVLDQVLGVKPQHVHDVKSWLALIHPEDRERMEHRSQELISGRTKDSDSDSEYRIIRPCDSAVRWISGSSEQSRDPVNDSPLLLVTLRDVTDTKQAALALENAARAKAEFFASLSHEVRTPLNGVIGMAQLLTMSDLEEEHAQWARVILTSSQDLLRIINDILDFSKMEAGKLVVTPHPFSPADLLTTLRVAHTVQAQAGNVELTVSAAPDLPEVLLGDALRLRQILGNLLGNALKFSPGGSVSVEADVVATTATLVTLCFRITDTGIGMTAATLDGLFTPYFQADHSTARRFGGTGLGLSICKQLTDLMGGRIEVESAPGTGSRFHVTLPFAVPPAPTSARP